MTSIGFIICILINIAAQRSGRFRFGYFATATILGIASIFVAHYVLETRVPDPAGRFLPCLLPVLIAVVVYGIALIRGESPRHEGS